MVWNNEKLMLMVPGVLRSLKKENPESISLDDGRIKSFLDGMNFQTVVHEGNFTVVTISSHRGDNFLGIAKRHPKDAYSKIRGISLAASRALRQAILSYK